MAHAQPSPDPPGAVSQEPDELLEDALIAEATEATAHARPALTLFRPLAQVSFAAQHWSSTVDHEALQSAIVCCPVSAAATRPFEQALIAVVPMALSARPEGVPTLHVTLSADDIAAVEQGVRRASRASGLRLVRAAALPISIAGAEPASAGLAAAALSAYRTAALIHAWNAVFGAPPAGDLERDRDAAAVNLLSTLRGLLGET
ncbi:MAG: hypothetical protein JOY86_00185 [Candidatus Eremiobacteraeota bacterium]|nr:hypothetical protein [Candidatus Eremiobacteraeota bacterium]